MRTFPAQLLRVIDGDTILVLADLGMGIYRRTRLRLDAIDAPPDSTPEGKRATSALELLMAGEWGNALSIDILDDPGAYDRYSARVRRSDGLLVNDWMVEQGFAIAMPSGRSVNGEHLTDYDDPEEEVAVRMADGSSSTQE